MSLTKRECLRILENIDYPKKEKLRIITKVIEDEPSCDEQVKFPIHRAKLLYELGEWNKALLDLNFIEQHNMMTDPLYLMKWKCMVYCNVAQIREEIIHKLDNKVICSNEHIDFLGQISEDMVTQMVQGNKTRASEGLERMKNK